MLEILGFNVLEFQSGMQAVKIVQLEKPKFHLVISDFRMPGMNGVEMLTTLSKLYPGLRKILCSGTPEGECFHGQAPKDVVFLEKPFSLQGLVSAVVQALT